MKMKRVSSGRARSVNGLKNVTALSDFYWIINFMLRTLFKMTYSRGKYPRNYSFQATSSVTSWLLRIVSYDKRRKRTRRTAMKEQLLAYLQNQTAFSLQKM